MLNLLRNNKAVKSYKYCKYTKSASNLTVPQKNIVTQSCKCGFCRPFAFQERLWPISECCSFKLLTDQFAKSAVVSVGWRYYSPHTAGHIPQEN